MNINLKITMTVATAVLATACDPNPTQQDALAEYDTQICVDRNKVRVPDANCNVANLGPTQTPMAAATPAEVPPGIAVTPPAGTPAPTQTAAAAPAPVVVNSGGGGAFFYPWFISSGGYYPSVGAAATSGSSTPIFNRSYRSSPPIATRATTTPGAAKAGTTTRGGFGGTAAASRGAAGVGA